MTAWIQAELKETRYSAVMGEEVYRNSRIQVHCDTKQCKTREDWESGGEGELRGLGSLETEWKLGRIGSLDWIALGELVYGSGGDWEHSSAGSPRQVPRMDKHTFPDA